MNFTIGNSHIPRQQPPSSHIFYCFSELDKYIHNAVSFIVSGIRQGEHVLLVENDRIHLLISKLLKKNLTNEQLTNLHFINNFHFYWRNGNFHPATILSFFTGYLDTGITNNWSYRIWGHVEWGNQEDIFRHLKDFEAPVPLPVMNALSVCAYDAQRVSDKLKQTLQCTHGYLMTDDDMVLLSN